MIPVNFNRLEPFFWLLILILASGCSQQPSRNFAAIGQQPPPLVEDEFAIVSPVEANFADSEDSVNPFVEERNGTIWDRLVSLYALPEVDNGRIEHELDWFLSHPDYLVKIQKRAAPYLHLILDEIESKQLPGELALLPVVESAFKPDAYSSASASGLWQFIPSTGRLFGLKQNNWYDGRLDVYASTQAATLYLRELGEAFDGDWFLALASYNYGKGNVRKAIEKNLERHLPTDYWSLTLPGETSTYVPKLMAVAKIFAHPERYNIPLQDIPDEPYFEVVNMDAQLDLQKAAELADTSMTEMIKLNPAFKRRSTAPNGPHRLLIPVEQVQTFKANLANLPKAARVSKRTLALAEIDRLRRRSIKHKIHPGESLSGIAHRYGTTVAKLRRANHLRNNRIRAGKLLLVPAIGEKTVRPATIGTRIYRVKAGDTIWNLARQFSVSASDLYRWNRLAPNALLRVGQKLVIKITPDSLAANGFRVHYTVQQGDSLAQISRKFNVSVTDLRRWNEHKMGKYLQPGQQLTVMVDNAT